MLTQEASDALYALELDNSLDITDPDVAKFLYLSALGAKAKNIIEIGSGGGYATIWLAMAAQANGGTVKSYEADTALAEKAKASLEKAGLSTFVEIIAKDARDAIRGDSDPIDLVYVDADEAQYETYFDVVYKRLNIGSVILADRITENESQLEDYVSYMQNHPNLESVTIPMVNGLEMTVKIE